MFCYVLDFITLVVHVHGRGTRLGTCLVQQQCVSSAVALPACSNSDKCFCYVLDFIMLVVHGHGRGTCLGICLVQQQCVSHAMAFAACSNADKYSVMFLISLHWLCTGMDEARALVHALCSSSVFRVPWPLQHVSMFQCPGWVRVWTRHASSVRRVCRGLCCGRHRCWILLPKVVIWTHTHIHTLNITLLYCTWAPTSPKGGTGLMVFCLCWGVEAPFVRNYTHTYTTHSYDIK